MVFINFIKNFQNNVHVLKIMLSQPSDNYDRISIYGSEDFINRVRLALDLLKNVTPDALILIKNHIRLIVFSKKYYGSELFRAGKLCKIGSDAGFTTTTWLAGAIAHEAYRAFLYDQYKKNNPSIKKVPVNEWRGYSGEKKCRIFEYELLKRLNAPIAEISAVKESIT